MYGTVRWDLTISGMHSTASHWRAAGMSFTTQRVDGRKWKRTVVKGPHRAYVSSTG